MAFGVQSGQERKQRCEVEAQQLHFHDSLWQIESDISKISTQNDGDLQVFPVNGVKCALRRRRMAGENILHFWSSYFSCHCCCFQSQSQYLAARLQRGSIPFFSFPLSCVTSPEQRAPLISAGAKPEQKRQVLRFEPFKSESLAGDWSTFLFICLFS